jgi:hypothetical protein
MKGGRSRPYFADSTGDHIFPHGMLTANQHGRFRGLYKLTSTQSTSVVPSIFGLKCGRLGAGIQSRAWRDRGHRLFVPEVYSTKDRDMSGQQTIFLVRKAPPFPMALRPGSGGSSGISSNRNTRSLRTMRGAIRVSPAIGARVSLNLACSGRVCE